MSVITGLAVSTEVPKSPLSSLAEVDVELLVERLVQAQLLARALNHMGRRPVAHDGQHRVYGNHPAYEEGHGEQAQVGEQDHHQEVAKALGVGRQALRRPCACSPW